MYRNEIMLTVLSEDPIPERMDLIDIVRECDEGAYVLHSFNLTSGPLTDEQMADALREAGSEPGL